MFIYLEMIVPGTAGGQGPLGSPGGRRLVSVLCCMGAQAVTLWHIQVSAERLCYDGEEEEKRSNASAYEIDFFSFPLVKC